MAMKKAQLSTQFAWIFILLAGAIILIFFLSLVYKERAISETKLSVSVLTQLETIFAGAELSTGSTGSGAGTVLIIDTPRLELSFTCDETDYSSYTLEGTNFDKETPFQVIFAPNILKGKQFLSWTLEWSAPFKVTNFLSLTDPNIKYVFVDPSTPSALEILETFPPEMTSETINSLSNFQKSKGYHKIRFIFFNQFDNTQELPKISKEIDVSAIRIQGTEDGGTIYFYERETNLGKSYLIEKGFVPYIDPPSLYGAFFTQDITSYKCTMKKAIKRLNLVSQVYQQRQEDLKNYTQTHSTLCDYRLYHTDPADPLPSIVTHSKSCIDLNTCINYIKTDITGIINKQDIVIRGSCPHIY